MITVIVSHGLFEVIS